MPSSVGGDFLVFRLEGSHGEGLESFPVGGEAEVVVTEEVLVLVGACYFGC